MVAKLLLPVGLAVLVMGMLWQLMSYSERLGAAEVVINENSEARDEHNAAIEKFKTALAAHEASRRKATSEAALWRRRWVDAQEDTKVREWADTPLPAAVRERLRERTQPYTEVGPTVERAPEAANSSAPVP